MIEKVPRYVLFLFLRAFSFLSLYHRLFIRIIILHKIRAILWSFNLNYLFIFSLIYIFLNHLSFIRVCVWFGVFDIFGLYLSVVVFVFGLVARLISLCAKLWVAEVDILIIFVGILLYLYIYSYKILCSRYGIPIRQWNITLIRAYLI